MGALVSVQLWADTGSSRPNRPPRAVATTPRHFAFMAQQLRSPLLRMIITRPVNIPCQTVAVTDGAINQGAIFKELHGSKRCQSQKVSVPAIVEKVSVPVLCLTVPRYPCQECRHGAQTAGAISGCDLSCDEPGRSAG